MTSIRPMLVAFTATTRDEWNRVLVTPLWTNNPFGDLINRTAQP